MLRRFLNNTAAERRDAAARAAEARLDATRRTAHDALQGLSGAWQGLGRWAGPERPAVPPPTTVPAAKAAMAASGWAPAPPALPVKAVVLAAAAGAIATACVLLLAGRQRRG